MHQLGSFIAISAIYFGLASAVGAQPQPSAPRTVSSPADPRPQQDHFQHPLMTSCHASDARSPGR